MFKDARCHHGVLVSEPCQECHDHYNQPKPRVQEALEALHAMQGEALLERRQNLGNRLHCRTEYSIHLIANVIAELGKIDKP